MRADYVRVIRNRIGLIELGIGLIELGIGLIELGIGLMELGIGLRINNARRTVLARVSGLVIRVLRQSVCNTPVVKFLGVCGSLHLPQSFMVIGPFHLCLCPPAG